MKRLFATLVAWATVAACSNEPPRTTASSLDGGVRTEATPDVASSVAEVEGPDLADPESLGLGTCVDSGLVLSTEARTDIWRSEDVRIDAEGGRVRISALWPRLQFELYAESGRVSIDLGHGLVADLGVFWRHPSDTELDLLGRTLATHSAPSGEVTGSVSLCAPIGVAPPAGRPHPYDQPSLQCALAAPDAERRLLEGRALLLVNAVRVRDAAALRGLVHPEKGLRIQLAEPIAWTDLAHLDGQVRAFDPETRAMAAGAYLAQMFEKRSRFDQRRRRWAGARWADDDDVPCIPEAGAWTFGELPWVAIEATDEESALGHGEPFVVVFDRHRSAWRVVAVLSPSWTP